MSDALVDAYVGVGSSIDPVPNIRAAFRELAAVECVSGASRFYRTAALDRPGDPDFVNGALRVRTRRGPGMLRDELRRIESILGRVRTGDAYAPRTIDLDLVLYGTITCDGPEIVLPDPDIRTRAFLAAPLVEISPDLTLPDTGESIASLAIMSEAASLEVVPELASIAMEVRHES